ncbi:MAG: hypothetical protein A2297_03135 [Elusimicrobia bacterium RIFOXYB2_FULL_48_7]|nr:MAG: hypothetical protein A2297_03135 [Elusimicrobia bacterium RIFOXYB2_FULL_48_7]
MKFNFTVHRYQIIFVILVFILTGSVKIVSKGTQQPYAAMQQRYPHSVALTFDDGPYPGGSTHKLLDILENENVKATFFVVGSHSRKNPELMKLIASKGHEFGGHTYNHRHIKKLTRNALLNELEITRTIIKNTTGKNTYLFRPPGGQYSKKNLSDASLSGYTTVLWSVLPKDCESSTTSEDIIQNVLSNTRPNGIILLHMGRERTLEALPKIICMLRLRGFKFLTVSQMMLENRNPNENSRN